MNKNNKIKHLRVVFTTLRLLKLAMKNKLIASDGTNCLKSFFKVWGKPDTENWYEEINILVR